METALMGPRRAGTVPPEGGDRTGRKKMTPNLLKKRLIAALQNFSGEICWDAPLAPYTSLKVGGPADVLLFPRSVAEVTHLMEVFSEHRLPYFILGNGSNLIVKDGGIEGAVLHLKHLNRIERIDERQLFAESGVSYPKLALYALDEGLSGLEFAAGIPGSVGGAVVMNAGVPDAETAQRLESVTLIKSSGDTCHLSARELTFFYRKTTLPEGVLVSAVFDLTETPADVIRAKMKQFLKRRQLTQPLQFPNCGSVFKNLPNHAAGALIEAAQLKGFRAGNAEISSQHANFIINRGSATAADCLALIAKMRDTVAHLQGITLELEVKVVGRNEIER